MESLLFAAGLTTFALGGAMTLFAWSVVRQNRRREVARVELLSALTFPDNARIDSSGPDASFHMDEFEADEFRRERPLATSSFFVEPEASGASSRRAIVLAALCLVTTAFVGSYRWFGGTNAAVPSAGASPTTMSASPTPMTAADQDARIELVALEHNITAAEFLVTGRIRNPIGGTPLHDVVAVVNVKDGTGRSLTTVRAPVTRAVINAGESSDFSAAAADATNVGGYSVRFDARERDTIPQIDRRPAESSSRSGQ
jgi:hypothetical protein